MAKSTLKQCGEVWISVEHFRNEFQEKELTHLGELCYFATPRFVLNYCEPKKTLNITNI